MATIIAATLALAQGPSPARADNTKEVLGLILGIAAVYAIGRTIQQSNTDASAPVTRRIVPEAIRPDAVMTSIRPQPRRSVPWSEREFRREVPSECLYRFDTQNGPVDGLGAECLANTMHRADRLPGECVVTTRIGRADRRIYSANCLERRGWKLASQSAGVWRPGGRIGD
jgi:hypothetical protein